MITDLGSRSAAFFTFEPSASNLEEAIVFLRARAQSRMKKGIVWPGFLSAHTLAGGSTGRSMSLLTPGAGRTSFLLISDLST